MSADRNLRLEVILAAIDKATAPIKAVTGSSKGLSAATKEARDRLRELEQQNKRLENFRTVARDVGVTGSALQAAQAKVKGLAREIAASDAPSKTLLRNFEAAKREAGQLKDRHQSLTQQQQRLRTEITASGVPLQGMARHQADLRGRIDDATGALRRQEAALKANGERMQRMNAARAQYDNALQVRNKLAGAGAASMAVGGGALYAGARFASPGLEFDEEMASVQALTRLESASTVLAELRRQARELGASTSYTATQVAQGQGFLAMAGFDPAAIQAAMPGMLALSKAGRTELAQTADIASNVLTGFGLSADQADRLGDALVGTFTRSNVNLAMLGDTMRYVAPVAAGLGVELETAAALAGKLGDAGIQGSQAGTAMRAILSRLAAPPKMAADAMDELRISARDAAGNLRDVPEILAEIDAKTRTMGDAERAGYLKAIAGTEAFSALSVLATQAGSGELQQFITTLKAAEGEAARNAATMANNARGDILSLQSAWQDLGISVFETQNGPLRGLIQTITRITRGVGDWARENPVLAGTLVKIAAAIAVTVTAVGALLVMAAAVLGPLAAVKFALTVLAINGGALGATLVAIAKGAIPLIAAALKGLIGLLIANPIGAAVAAIAIAATLIYTYWEPIKAFFGGLWDGIKATFDGGVSAIGAALLNWNPLGLFHQAFAGVLSWFGVELPGKFSDFGSMMITGLVNGITGSLGRAREAISGAGDNVIGWFKDRLGIHSPSRVFAELGGHTMEGLAIGLQRSGRAPLDVLSRTARQLTAAAGIGLAGVASAAGISIDARPPLAASSAVAGTSTSHTEIHIHAAPGMDPQAIARAVSTELDRREREHAARRRSRLTDID